MNISNNNQSFISASPFPKNYTPQLLVIEEGKGCRVKDGGGKWYLDFGAGIAVNALGHGNEELAQIAYEQMQKCIHVSNLYTTAPAVELADKLLSTGDFAAVHFGNSGSEANEAALKYARLYAQRTKGEGHHHFVCFSNAFHGRTMGALSCTPTEKYQKPFAPLLPGVRVGEYNDPAGLPALIDEFCSAVIVEPVQGEGGLTTMTEDFAAALQGICREKDVLIIADEIQTGLGRTGYPFGCNWMDLRPDIITLSKPLAAGLPLSATLIPKKINDLLQIGEHGTTFGGGPVTTAVANRVVDTLLDPEFLAEVREKADFMEKKLMEIVAQSPSSEGVLGRGLLRGIAMKDSSLISPIMEKTIKAGLLILRSGKRALRLAPPLTISKEEIEEGTAILGKIINEVEE